MLETFDCPACAGNDWETISTDRFVRGQKVRRDSREMEEYVALRRRVLFEVWFPDADEVHLTTVMCRGCGFLTYTPRPSTDDIDAKYRLLQREERHIGSHRQAADLELDRRRARRVFDAVATRTGEGPLDVLDFGGGSGRLLMPFREAGHNCFLIDYNVEPLDGITKLGDTLDDLDPERRFDVIICSHVIEHLADPAGHVEHFHHLLRDGGLVYGEVPMGIWKGIGISNDPVTHINFFTTYSFGRLFERMGFNVRLLERGVGHYTRRLEIIVAISTRDNEATAALANNGVTEARSRLNPHLGIDLSRRIRLHRYPSLRSVRRRLSKRRSGE
jgi:SAM-dependent methyltransferase